MSFENAFISDIAAADFGDDRYLRRYGERPHVSKEVLDTYSNAAYLGIDRSSIGAYQNRTDARYVAATDMSYDILMSVYDVNTRSMFACRQFNFEDSTHDKLVKYVNSLKKRKPNLEARLIGLQSKQDVDYLGQLADLVKTTRIKLVEVDLFGGDTRHIAIDRMLGTSYDVLMENRLYRPGELANKTTEEQFERRLKPGAP